MFSASRRCAKAKNVVSLVCCVVLGHLSVPALGDLRWRLLFPGCPLGGSHVLLPTCGVLIVVGGAMCVRVTCDAWMSRGVVLGRNFAVFGRLVGLSHGGALNWAVFVSAPPEEFVRSLVR